MQRVVTICLCFLAFVPVVSGQTRGDLIEGFDSGLPVLESYPGQDFDPADYGLESGNPFDENGLRLFGNTWKAQTIPAKAVADTTVWQIAVFSESQSQMQAFGVSDGQNELFYTFFGTDLPTATNWFSVYQGAFPTGSWHLFLLPLGRDWQDRFGYLPDLNQLIYVNDDDSGPAGAVVFDAIADVSEDLPRAPTARILYTVENQKQVSAKLYRLSIQFLGEVFDPDSADHVWNWDFGDSTTSLLQNPSHEFLVHADHPYTVGLTVTDPDGLAAGDTCQITVSPGSSEDVLTVNFVGDIFTGRGYENSGGIIDSQGIEALFAPTQSIFGQAADVNVANLEVSYTNRGTRHPTKSVVFRSHPENISGIQYAGVDLVTIGNNHIIDYGEIGMLDTMQGLDNLNIGYSGAGSNEYMALLPTFWTENGIRLGFLGLCNRTGRQWNYQPFLDAGFDKPGFAYLLPRNLTSAINYTLPLADICIVQTHSGDEYETAPEPDSSLGGAYLKPVRVEAGEIFASDSDFKFRSEPTPGERELRRLAIDLGADVLINHHPHVLQGFESYQGKLIAHSLGNFIFDLYYPETMPTLVLTLEIEKTGITGYRFTPAWINHWIPEPVSGNLQREIIDRLADYSRPMNALVVPLAESGEARIHLNRANVDSTTHSTTGTIPLQVSGAYSLSSPIELIGKGNLSSITGIDGGGTWEVRYGREILWHGGFEDEGADLWEVNTSDEDLVTDLQHSGERSLRLRRYASASGQTGTDLEKHLPCDPTREHSAVAWFRAENARQARTMVRFYDSRYSETPLTDIDLSARFDGTTEWVRQWRDLDTPSNAVYFELRCGHEPPAEGTGFSWYDDLAFIEWEPWADATAEQKIPSPNNYRFLQIRGPAGSSEEVDLTYRETSYGNGSISSTNQDTPGARVLGLKCFPNPFNPRITIDLELPLGAGGGLEKQTTVEIIDLRGHIVRNLHRGLLTPGKRHGMTWDGKDDSGRGLSSGVYLVQVKWGDWRARQKITLIR